MKTAKLVLGILSICTSALVWIQSFAAGIADALSDSDELGGPGGLIVALLMLTAGIVMITTRSSERRGGSAACLILYLLAALFGFATAGSFEDLKLWSSVCLILAAVNMIALINISKQMKAGKRSREAFDKGGEI